MSDYSAALAATKPQARSRVSNGSSLLPSVDGRSVWARLMRDTLSALLAHCGGDAAVSETKRMAARRVSVLEAELVFLEDKFARLRAEGREPEPADLDLYGRLADRQRRLAEPLGWERTQRDITDTVESIAAEYAERRATKAADSFFAPSATSPSPADEEHAGGLPKGSAS